MSQEFSMTPIAHIHSDFAEKFGVPRQSGLVEELEADIVFEPAYQNPDALRGLEDFSHTAVRAVRRMSGRKWNNGFTNGLRRG